MQKVDKIRTAELQYIARTYNIKLNMLTTSQKIILNENGQNLGFLRV